MCVVFTKTFTRTFIQNLPILTYGVMVFFPRSDLARSLEPNGLADSDDDNIYTCVYIYIYLCDYSFIGSFIILFVYLLFFCNLT